MELGEERNDIVVLDADLSKSTKTIKFAEKFPERFFNIGIKEQDMMNTAAGLATANKIPIVSTYAIFVGRAWEQIRNTIARANLKVKIVATHAGISNYADGSSHQALEDIAIMRVIPKMCVIVPADEIEARKAIKASVDYPSSVYIRLCRDYAETVFNENYEFVVGKAVELKNGNDLTLISTGLMTSKALFAAEILQIEGINVRVVHIPTIKPIDEEQIIKAAKETGGIITAEEHSVIGGLGSAVAEVLVENFPVPIEMIGVRNAFGQSGDPNELYEIFGLTSNAIVNAAKRVLLRK